MALSTVSRRSALLWWRWSGLGVRRALHAPNKGKRGKQAFHLYKEEDMPATEERHANVIGPLEKLLGRSLEYGQSTDITDGQMKVLVEGEDQRLTDALYVHADSITQRIVGKKVHLRGLVELSNECHKSCYYCGIGAGVGVPRYTMSTEETLEVMEWAQAKGYGSVMFQSGERKGGAWVDHVCDLLRRLPHDSSSEEESGKAMVVALSLGELTRKQYSKLLEVGAKRYLLRIEASNPELYRRLHPEDHSYEKRVQCLKDLKELGFQVGTGIMVGLPFQTVDDLVSDIRFFQEMDVDMVGMGPYVPHADTKLGVEHLDMLNLDSRKKKRAYDHAMFEQTCRMNAVTRLVMGNVNVAATTALQVSQQVIHKEEEKDKSRLSTQRGERLRSIEVRTF